MTLFTLFYNMSAIGIDVLRMMRFGLLMMLLCRLESAESAMENCVSRDEFNTLKHDIKSQIASLSETVETQASEIETLKEEKMNFEAEARELRRMKTFKAINDKPKDLNQTQNEMKQVTSKRRIRIPYEQHDTGNKRYLLGPVTGGIAFSVTLSQWELANLGRAQTIHFDNVISNLGNAYNSHTGTFTVPVRGWYVFSLTLMSSADNVRQQLDVVVNNSPIFQCYAAGAIFNSVSRTIVSHISSGDAVWVRTSLLENSNRVHGAGHTSFTGFLLYAD